MSRKTLIGLVLVTVVLGGFWVAGCESETRETERKPDAEKLAEPPTGAREEGEPAEGVPSTPAPDEADEARPEAAEPADPALETETTKKMKHAHLASAKIPGEWVGRDEVPGKITAYKFKVLEEIEGQVSGHSQEKASESVLETRVEFSGTEGARAQARVLVTIEYKD